MRTNLRSQSGYSLLELMIATGLMVVVTGAIFSMMDPSQGTFRVQPEVLDVQQRMRVASDVLYKDLIMAGAGPYQGPATGGLVSFFAPILPRRMGQMGADSYTVYRSDVITLTYVPNTFSQTTIRDPMPPTSTQIKVNDQPNCPGSDPLCGFAPGMNILLFNASGNFDVITITNISGDSGMISHQGQGLTVSYGAGSGVTQVQTHTYWLDRATNQLRHYDGYQTDLPVVDNVVDLKFTYFGDADPPLYPEPPFGTPNHCVYDEAGKPRGADLGEGLVELTQAMLIDGQPRWCGTDSAGNPTSNSYDPDLLRVREIRVDLRVQVAASDLRGTDTSLFITPGTAAPGARWVPDYRMRFDVAPRNMNLMR